MVFPLMTTLPFEDGFKARFEYWTPFPALDVFSAESIEYVGEEDVVHRGQKRRVRRFNYAGQAYWVTDDRQLVVWGISMPNGPTYELVDEAAARAYIDQWER